MQLVLHRLHIDRKLRLRAHRKPDQESALRSVRTASPRAYTARERKPITPNTARPKSSSKMISMWLTITRSRVVAYAPVCAPPLGWPLNRLMRRPQAGAYVVALI